MVEGIVKLHPWRGKVPCRHWWGGEVGLDGGEWEGNSSPVPTVGRIAQLYVTQQVYLPTYVGIQGMVEDS